MKNILANVIAISCIAASCSSEPEDTSKNEIYPRPTHEANLGLMDSMYNTKGEVDAISAKYNLGEDTVREIYTSYIGLDLFEQPHLVARSDTASKKKQVSVRTIVNALADKYNLPYSTVGGVIFDMKVLELAAKSETDE